MRKVIGLYLIQLVLFSCGKDDMPKEEVIGKQKEEVIGKQPEIASLVFPIDNSECIEGIIISKIKSKVTFNWNDVNNASSYELKLKNLKTVTTIGYNTKKSELEIILDRGIAYSWCIISKSDTSSERTESEIWKFYNTGVAVSSYAPFPSEVVSPTINEEIEFNPDGIELKWKSADVDNDIYNHDIYLGETNLPGLYREHYTTNSIANVKVKANTRYFWKIKTMDKSGNISYSDVFQFKIK